VDRPSSSGLLVGALSLDEIQERLHDRAGILQGIFRMRQPMVDTDLFGKPGCRLL